MIILSLQALSFYNAKIDPKSALANEDVLPQWLLQVVVNEKNKDAQWAKDLVAAYHSQEFKDYMEKITTAYGSYQKVNK